MVYKITNCMYKSDKAAIHKTQGKIETVLNVTR